jgi:hypothetical protein
MNEGELPEQDPWGAPKLTTAVRLLQRQYADDLAVWRNLWQTVGANADIVDKHTKLRSKITFGGDVLHMEVAKMVNQHEVTRAEAEEATVCCRSLRDDCARLTQELLSRDKQIEDAVARCHVMATANTLALQALAGSVGRAPSTSTTSWL